MQKPFISPLLFVCAIISRRFFTSLLVLSTPKNKALPITSTSTIPDASPRRSAIHRKRMNDGYKYRGRGLIQITGRANYAAYNSSKYCKGDVVNHPELLAKPLGAVKSSMWFFDSHNLNKYADKDDLVKITKIINGGTNGLEHRRAFLEKAKSVLLKN